jgi:hypothetical protein
MSLNKLIVAQEKIQYPYFPGSTEEKLHYSQYVASQTFDPGTLIIPVKGCVTHIFRLYITLKTNS